MLRCSCVRLSVVDFLKHRGGVTMRREKVSLLRPTGATDAPLTVYGRALTSPDPILERKCVRDWVFPTCDKSFGAEPQKTAILLIGNPGIGKSCALNAIAAYLIDTKGLDNDLHILFGLSGTNVRHIYKAGDEWLSELLTTEELNLLSEVNTKPPQPNWVWLQDTERDRIPPFVSGAMLNVLASSPNRKNYSVWENKVHYSKCRFDRLCLPVWSWDEIKCGAQACGVDKWVTKERFDKYGGIPRLLFKFPDVDEDHTLQAAVKSFDVDAFVKNGNMPNNPLVGSASHRLIQLIPGDMGVGFTLDWMTPYVARLILNRQAENNFREVMQFARLNNRGLALENAVIAFINRSRVIRATLLQTDGAKGAVTEFVIPNETVDFKTASEFLEKAMPVFAVPLQMDYPFVDCFLYTGTKLYGIQITHGRKHSTSHVAVRQMLHDLGHDNLGRGRKLDGLILVDEDAPPGWKGMTQKTEEDDAVNRVSVEMPPGWKDMTQEQKDNFPLQVLPDAPKNKILPSLQDAADLNTPKTLPQYHWRFVTPKDGDAVFKVKPAKSTVDWLKKAVKAHWESNNDGKLNVDKLTVRDHMGKEVLSASTQLEGNTEGTAYIVSHV